MKAVLGVFVVAMVWLTACGSMPGEDQLQAGGAAVPEQNLQTQESALTGDCSVTIECSNGTTRTCNGTGGACAASGANGGKVTCNGVVTSCGLIIVDPPCTCGADRCCNQFCALDPDCRLSPEPQG